MNEERHIQGWETIAALTLFSVETVRKKFGKEMLEAGLAFKSKIGRSKRVVIWSYPSLIKAYFSKKQSKNLSV